MPPRPAPADRPARRAGLVLGLLLATLGPTRAADPGPIPWRRDFESARGEARVLDRPLWIQFTGPWCGYCRQMERESFTRPDVVALSRRRFVPVRVRTDEEEELTRRFNITGIPATILLAPSGDLIARLDGYADPATFRKLLDQASAEPSSGVALGGYCPVTLVRTGRLCVGRANLALRHEGRDYRFADISARDSFRDNPLAYVPVEDGRCVVSRVETGRSVPGDPSLGVLYRGRLYLCADAAARARFASNPERFSHSDLDRLRGSVPRRVRPGPLPSPDHLEASHADTATSLR